MLSTLAASAATHPPVCKNTITAKVSAIEQVYFYNRFGTFNPAGMMYALDRDLVPVDPKTKRAGPGNARLRDDKRPRPLVLRVNEGDCLEVTFTNLLSPERPLPELTRQVPKHATEPPNSSIERVTLPMEEESEYPLTRAASMHVNGLSYLNISSDGANVGANASSLVKPGQKIVYKWYAEREGGYLLYSMGHPSGGEGDGGQLSLGLFGAVNVEPRGSSWFRSQVTHDQLQGAVKVPDKSDYTNLDYSKLSILNGRNEIIHSDLNAIVYQPDYKNDPKMKAYCKDAPPSSSCGYSFREFTTIFHDEITAVQAFSEIDNEQSPLRSLKDGTAINYGSAGMGSILLANAKGIGPAKDCKECKFEEFFLTSWANGDPALLLERDADGKAKRALFPEDPSNVHHSYMGDPVRFRNMHAGPKETHVFHLHAHQWLQDQRDQNSTYLDSQTISPGASFTYHIQYGGSGNRNSTVGDSIFHCHLYPHFAQGMWELWRTHDVFEDGTPGLYDASANPHGRNLPDGEIAGGTPNPAVVPIPGYRMPPPPSKEFQGYPFYIAAKEGHRPPQPPLDMDTDGGLPRHRIESATLEDKAPLDDTLSIGGEISARIAKRVATRNGEPMLTFFDRRLKSAKVRILPQAGTEAEQTAMRFHHGLFEITDWKHGKVKATPYATEYGWKTLGYKIQAASLPPGAKAPAVGTDVFELNGRAPQHGAPYSDPCPADAPLRDYRTAYIQFDMTVNKWGWHDPQARITVLENDVRDTLNYVRPAEPLFFRVNSGDCVQYKATNLVPSALNLDDYQIFSPTDTIGQHIHLVKFDVTSSDGSGNGWNYEDATFSADEVRERIKAINREPTNNLHLTPSTHPMFRFNGSMAGDKRGLCADLGGEDNDRQSHPWCGAQTTIQRWWADPLLNKDGQDRTLRSVFTHDHLGPSTHQHHGLYGALVVEPARSTWETLDGKVIGGSDGLGKPLVVRSDGGPTSYAANILVPKSYDGACEPKDGKLQMDPDGWCKQKNENKTRREFNLAFADFSLLYTMNLKPIAQPSRNEDEDLPGGQAADLRPEPEGISTSDPGTQLLNYRQEPIPLRVGKVGAKDEDGDERYRQKEGPQGDMANVFSSEVHAAADEELYQPIPVGADAMFQKLEKQRRQFMGNLNEPWRKFGDPGTHLLAAYEGDPVQLRLIQGAQEENHIFNMHGMKWRSQVASPNSGWVNAQPIGISEHMEFDMKVAPEGIDKTDYLYSSTATDNYWDGMWGILRAFGEDQPGLKRLPADVVPVPQKPRGIDRNNICPADIPLTHVHVSAWRACELFTSKEFYLKHKKCDPKAPGIDYNRRFGISDPNAIVFVENPDFGTGTQPPRDEIRTILQAKYGNKNPALRKEIEPLILRAPAGACLEVHLYNNLPKDWHLNAPDGLAHPESWSFNAVPPIVEGFNFNHVRMSANVSLHSQLVGAYTWGNDGSYVGFNEDSTVKPFGNRTYRWYAGDRKLDSEGKIVPVPIEFGATNLRDMGDVIKHASHGAVGALIIEPRNTYFKYPDNPDRPNADEYARSRATADIYDATTHKLLFRDFALVYQDDLSLKQNGQALPNLRNGDDAEDTGQKGFNYRTEPIWARMGMGGPAIKQEAWNSVDLSNAFSSVMSNPGCRGKCGDPETPVFHAKAGTEIRFRILDPAGHPRNHAFTLFGHNWDSQPWTDGSAKMGDNPLSARLGSFSGIGPMRHLNIRTTAGGAFGVPGDYLYRTQEGFMFAGGMWGILRVQK